VSKQSILRSSSQPVQPLVIANGQAYTEDNNGNLRDDGTRTFAYDAANRLISVTNGAAVSSQFSYDGLGNRVGQTVGGNSTSFVLDVAGGLPQVIVETTAGQTNRYLTGLAQQQGTTWLYPLPDAAPKTLKVYAVSGPCRCVGPHVAVADRPQQPKPSRSARSLGWANEWARFACYLLPSGEKLG